MPGGGRGVSGPGVPPWVSGEAWNGASRKIWNQLMAAWAQQARQAKWRGLPVPEQPVWLDKTKNPAGWELQTQRRVAAREAAEAAAAAAAAGSAAAAAATAAEAMDGYRQEGAQWCTERQEWGNSWGTRPTLAEAPQQYSGERTSRRWWDE